MIGVGSIVKVDNFLDRLEQMLRENLAANGYDYDALKAQHLENMRNLKGKATKPSKQEISRNKPYQE